MRLHLSPLALGLLASLALAGPATARPAERAPDLRPEPEIAGPDYAAEAQDAFARIAPVGMAVAVVRGGKLAWSAGYGVEEAGRGRAVTGDTVFPVHSITKGFTSAALAMLVDEGRLDWNDPVVRHLPEFAMSDPYATAHITVRDILVHNSGLALGAGDLLSWPDQHASVAETIAALRYLPLDGGFREGFAYDNILYTVAGELVARTSGLSWESFVAQRLFGPLGMTSCTTSAPAGRQPGHAVQHARAGGGAPRPLSVLAIAPDPAGSISCSVNDMAKWAAFQLGDGTAADGTRLISAEQMAVMHRPVVPVGAPNFLRRLGGVHLNDYAPGWLISDFAGTLAIDHGGTGPGGTTELMLLPDHDAAVVVLTNDMRPGTFLAYRLADRIARGAQAADWIGWAVEREARRAAAAGQGGAPDFAPGTPARALSAYAGTYRDPWYGEIEVVETPTGRGGGKGLAIRFSRSRLLRGPLVPLGGDRFLARWPERSLEADALVTFEGDGGKGAIAGMTLRAASAHTDFSYDYQHLRPVKVR